MKINGLQKLTLLDYPEKLAATVFTAGCNLRCPFCHNATLVTQIENSDHYTEDEVLTFLKKRKGKLDGICITGGEPLIHNDIANFIKKVRELGFLIKLDTNGSFPEKLKSLLDKGLLDYVAMDIKNTPEKYALTVGIPDFDCTPVFESAKILMQGNTPYEFRTTLVHELHTAQDMKKIGQTLEKAKNYYLQSFEDSGDLVGFTKNAGISPLTALTKVETSKYQHILAQYIEHVEVRA